MSTLTIPVKGQFFTSHIDFVEGFPQIIATSRGTIVQDEDAWGRSVAHRTGLNMQRVLFSGWPVASTIHLHHSALHYAIVRNHYVFHCFHRSS